jgi:hypothetical protein
MRASDEQLASTTARQRCSWGRDSLHVPQMVSMILRTLGRFWFRLLAILVACAAPFEPIRASAVPVRHVEGLMHGFLALRTLGGKRLADGEMTQVAEGDRADEPSNLSL